MVTIPDARSSLGVTRRIPQSSRGIVSYNSRAGEGLQQAGKAMGQFGAELSAEAKKRSDEQYQLMAGRTMLDAMKADSDFIEQARNRPQDYATFKGEHEQVYKKNKETYLSQFTDDTQRAKVGLALDEQFVRTQNNISGLSREFRGNHVKADINQRQSDVLKMAYDNPDSAPALIASYNATLDGYSAAGDVDEDFAMQQKLSTADGIQKTVYKRGSADFEALSDDEKLKALSSDRPSGGFDAAVAVVFRHEGGYSAKDGNTNDPVNFGINQGAHKDVDVKNLTKDGAAKIYKTEYWDKYKIGELPENVQAIVMDGVVNHWTNKTATGFRDELVEAARNGASPGELIGMRRNEYRRLVESDPKKYGSNAESWENRLKTFEQSPVLARLSPEDRAKWSSPDQQKKLVENIAVNELSANPQAFIAKADSGEYDAYFNSADKLKYKEMALKVFENQKKNADNESFLQGAARNQDLYTKYLSNSPTLMDDIAKFRADATTQEDVQFADNMRDAYLKINPISMDERYFVENQLTNRYINMGIKPDKKKGRLDTGDVTLEDAIRLQRDAMKESARGVLGAKNIATNLIPAIQQLAGKELGSDDIGLFDGVEAYDKGYQVIQKFLEDKNKENDLALKSNLLSDFISGADAIPDNVKNDDALFDKRLETIANNVISRVTGAKASAAAQDYLRKNPSTAKDYDKTFGAGEANKVLGK